MADETTPFASASESTPPRRRAPRRAASRPAGAPEPGALSFSSPSGHPAREPEQQVDVLAAFGLGAPEQPADDAGESAPARAPRKRTRAPKASAASQESSDSPAVSEKPAKSSKSTRAPKASKAAESTQSSDAGEPTEASMATKPAKDTKSTKTKATGSTRAKASTSAKAATGKSKAAKSQPAGTEPGASEHPAAEGAAEHDAAPARPRRSRAKKKPADEAAPDAAAQAGDEAPAQALADADAADPAVGVDVAETELSDELQLPATALLFQPPVAAPRRRRRATRATQAAEPSETAEEATAESEEAAEEVAAESEAAAAGGEAQPEDDGPAEEDAPAEDDAPDGAESSSSRRRRRRGGRGRRRPSDSGDSADTSEPGAPAPTAPEPAPAGEPAAGQAGESEDDEAGGSRRRRRRRGKRAEDDGGARAARDEVTALRGSTRLEAKRLRRREGRDAGRRRQIITEAEFLARRESVARDMVVREQGGVTQIAVLEDDVLVEHYVARAQQTAMVGNVYLGRVQNVLPSMEAAFVDLGRGRNAVLYAGEVNWDAAGLEGQPRRIEQALKSGDQILVQVTKDPIGHKGARLTSQITLAGRYLVLVPSGAMTGISRKLPDTERARLKKLLKEIVPEGQGVIVRTAAEGASEEELRRDVERLTAEWADIQARTQAKRVSAPVLLKGEPELALRVVRDVFNEDFSSLTIAGAGAWKTISEYIESVAPDLGERLHHWTSRDDVFASKRIDEQLAKGMDRKVWLPSGGSLVIDRTEAMTVVDVNTGKFTGSGGTLEETVTRNNLEAAEEIVRQLRLRDIGGIIVIDFIDMVLESNRDLVLRRLIECLGRDRTRHQVAEVTSLGLVQMTRKRVGQGLVEAFSTPCEHCHGRGFTVDAAPHEHVEIEVNTEEETPRLGRRRGGRSRGPAAPTNGAGGSSNGASGVAHVPADDDARAAVKATLAQIAAAAQQAHQAEEGGGEGDPEGAEGAAPAAGDESAAAVAVVVSADGIVLRPAAGPVVSHADQLAALAALEAALPGAVADVAEAIDQAAIEAHDDAENDEALAEAHAGVEEVIEAEIVADVVQEPEIIEGEVYDPPLISAPDRRAGL